MILSVMKPFIKILNDQDKILFEKALRFYLFSNQQNVRNLDSDLQERFLYSSRAAFTAIAGFLMDKPLNERYLLFLEMETRALCDLNPEHFKVLDIQPHEINKIVIDNDVVLHAYDEQLKTTLLVNYKSADNALKLLLQS